MSSFGRGWNGSTRIQQHASATFPTSNGITNDDLTWEENYRARARAMTRDYVNPNSTRLSHQRPPRADSRPQYNPQNYAASATQIKTNPPPRVGCFNIFFGAEDESRPRIDFDQTYISNYPSQLPRTRGAQEIQYGRPGRSISQESSYREGGGRMRSRSAGPGPRPPSGRVDPYKSPSFSPPRNSFDALQRSVFTFNQSNSSSTRLSAARVDPLRDTLLMFGEEQSSNGTGLSQQELLQRKEREKAVALRKENKQRHSPNRKKVVNLPSSLFPLHNRQQQQLMQQQKQQQQQQQQEQQDQQFASTTQPLQQQISSQSFHPTQIPQPQTSLSASFSNSSLNYSHESRQTPLSTSSVTPQKSALLRGKPEPTNPVADTSQSKDSRNKRSSMVRVPVHPSSR